MHLPIRVLLSLLLVGMIALVPSSAASQGHWTEPTFDARPLYVPGEILVQWQEGATAMAVRTAAAIETLPVLEEIAPLRAMRLAVPIGEEMSAAEHLSSHPLIAHAEPNFLAYASTGSDFYPDDPHWIKQWNMRRVEAVPAWALSTGKEETVVAVLDSGLDVGHPDLNPNLLAGYDFVSDDANPADDFGHGTHVTGIIAARPDNGRGVAGMAPDVSILPLKVLDGRGAGTYADIAAAIQYAAANGADIINMSLGGASPSSILEQAVQSAHAAGILLIASAGNQGQSGVTYPARYDGVLAVAATDHYDRWPSYSNWGPEVDLAAPGGTSADQIWSTWPGGYDWEYGTSMAVPHVSAAAALMWSVDPSLTDEEIADLLRSTADSVGQFSYTNGRNSYLGYGRLNAHEAVRQALPPMLATEPAQLVFLGDSQQAPATRQLRLSNESRQPLEWRAEKASGGNWLNLVAPLSGSIVYEQPGRLSALASTGSLAYGVYQGSLRVRSSTPSAQGVPHTVPVFLSLVPKLSRVYVPALVNDQTQFEWFVTTDGRQLSLGDEMSATVDLPWAFPFYENTYSRAWVGDNGLISFRQGYAGAAPDGSYVYSSDCLPSARQPNDAIYPFWDDLDPSKGGAIFAKAVDSKTFVIEWLEVPHFDGKSPETFQVVLRSDGRVIFQYRMVSNDSSVTVGVENSDGTMSWQWLCDRVGTRLRSGLAVSYLPPDL